MMKKSRWIFALILLTLGYVQCTRACEPDPEEPDKPRPANHFQPSGHNSLETFQQFEELPYEIKAIIFGSLPLEDFVNLPFISKKFREDFFTILKIFYNKKNELQRKPANYEESFIRKIGAWDRLRRHTNELIYLDNISYDLIAKIAQDKDISCALFVKFIEVFEINQAMNLNSKLVNNISTHIPEFDQVITFEQASERILQWYPCARLLKALNSPEALTYLNKSLMKLYDYWELKYQNGELPNHSMIAELNFIELLEDIKYLSYFATKLFKLGRYEESLLVYQKILSIPQLLRLPLDTQKSIKRLYGFTLMQVGMYSEALHIFLEINDKSNAAMAKNFL